VTSGHNKALHLTANPLRFIAAGELHGSRIAARFGNGPAELSGLKSFPRALIRAREQSLGADGPSAHSSAGPLCQRDEY
jgi:hypothetical protein